MSFLLSCFGCPSKKEQEEIKRKQEEEQEQLDVEWLNKYKINTNYSQEEQYKYNSVAVYMYRKTHPVLVLYQGDMPPCYLKDMIVCIELISNQTTNQVRMNLDLNGNILGRHCQNTGQKQRNGKSLIEIAEWCNQYQQSNIRSKIIEVDNRVMTNCEKFMNELCTFLGVKFNIPSYQDLNSSFSVLH